MPIALSAGAGWTLEQRRPIEAFVPQNVRARLSYQTCRLGTIARDPRRTPSSRAIQLNLDQSPLDTRADRIVVCLNPGRLADVEDTVISDHPPACARHPATRDARSMARTGMHGESFDRTSGMNTSELKAPCGSAACGDLCGGVGRPESLPRPWRISTRSTSRRWRTCLKCMSVPTIRSNRWSAWTKSRYAARRCPADFCGQTRSGSQTGQRIRTMWHSQCLLRGRAESGTSFHVPDAGPFGL